MRDALIQRFASPASLETDDMLPQKHQAALLEMTDRHMKSLQPLWDLLRLKTPAFDKVLQTEVNHSFYLHWLQNQLLLTENYNLSMLASRD